MKKLDHWPPRKVLRLDRVLTVSDWSRWRQPGPWGRWEIGCSMAWIAALCIAAILLFVAGAAVAYVYLRCPYCGASLCHGLRLPTRLPLYCPQCGKPLEDTDR